MSSDSDATKFFYNLTPPVVLDAIETTGVRCTGRMFAHASMENRVYEVQLEPHDGELPLMHVPDLRIIKFYRPGRWTKQQILEEHEFLFDLTQGEIPCVAPLRFEDGTSVGVLEEVEMFFAIFPKVRGKTCDELNEKQLQQIGRLLGRLHNIGQSKTSKVRERLTADVFGRDNLKLLLGHQTLPQMLADRYQFVVSRICELADGVLSKLPIQRVHGDCHGGNVLWNGEQCFLVDFDDMVEGPCVQDIWLLCPGRDEDAVKRRETLLDGYEQMREFDYSTLSAIETLRALRMIRFSAWIARRWEDPSFQRTFTRFGTLEYWREELIGLEEQLMLLGS